MEEQARIQEQYEETLKKLSVGDIVEGEIIAVSSDSVVMNIGGKSDGIVKKDEFLLDLYEDLLRHAAVGDKHNVMILATNDGAGNYVLSRIKVQEKEAKEELQKKFEKDEVLTGKIIKAIKGGLMVDLGSLIAFMPASCYDMKFVKDLDALVGSEVQGRIIEYNEAANKIIFSRKALLMEEYEKQIAEKKAAMQEAIKDLEIDQVVDGKIKNMTDYSVFVDLNGIDGFIHISDLTWSPIKKPADKFKIGQEIKAKITELDKEEFRIKLSAKALLPDPWEVFKKQYDEGDKAIVEITSLMKYGAFAKIIDDVEGLIHISQFAHHKVEKPEDMLKAGDQVEVLITKIDNVNKKVSLSIKELLPVPKRVIEKDKKVYSDNEVVTLGDLFGKIKL